MVISGPGSRLIFSQPRVFSFFVRLLVGYFIKTQMNTQMYAFALRNTTVYHISGCVVKILYPTLPRFQSKMAIVWDRSMQLILLSMVVTETHPTPSGNQFYQPFRHPVICLSGTDWLIGGKLKGPFPVEDCQAEVC